MQRVTPACNPGGARTAAAGPRARAAASGAGARTAAPRGDIDSLLFPEPGLGANMDWAQMATDCLFVCGCSGLQQTCGGERTDTALEHIQKVEKVAWIATAVR